MNEYSFINEGEMARPTKKLQDIESTAIRLFANRGLAQVTIKDIARQANCAEGALYRHYPSKEEMAWRLFRREVEDFTSKLRALWSTRASFTQKLHDGIDLFYTFFDENPVLFSFILLTQHDFPPEKKLRPQFNPDQLALQFVREGIKKRDFKILDAALGAAMLLGLVLHPPTMHAKGKLKGSMKNRVDEITDACLKVLNANAWQAQKIRFK
jgi:AcrR family transcriptional regulator